MALGKALNFSPASLVDNRKGKLSGDQFSALIGRFVIPLVLTILFAAAPFLCWAAITSSAQQVTFSAGLQLFGVAPFDHENRHAPSQSAAEVYFGRTHTAHGLYGLLT